MQLRQKIFDLLFGPRCIMRAHRSIDSYIRVSQRCLSDGVALLFEEREMAALAGIRRFRAIHVMLQTAVRKSGNRYAAGACEATAHLRLPVNLGTRVHLLGAQPRRSLTDADAKPEVDYSRLISVIREGGRTSSYNAVWLRENCRCDACFISATNQRAVIHYRLPPEAFESSHVTWVSQEGVVEVTWGDGHLSR